MAEIKIEKKSPMWPWILLILAIIAILIYIFAFSGNGDENDEMYEQTTIVEPVETLRVAPNNSSVAAYVSFIREDTDPMGLDHEFTNEALSRLTNATNSMANEIDYDIQKDMEQVKTHTDKIATDPFETTHANSIRQAAETLSNVLKNIQQRAFSGLTSDADEVKNAAMAIETDVLTLEQKEDVKNFFRESADLLEKMNNTSPQM